MPGPLAPSSQVDPRVAGRRCRRRRAPPRHLPAARPSRKPPPCCCEFFRGHAGAGPRPPGPKDPPIQRRRARPQRPTLKAQRPAGPDPPAPPLPESQQLAGHDPHAAASATSASSPPTSPAPASRGAKLVLSRPPRRQHHGADLTGADLMGARPARRHLRSRHPAPLPPPQAPRLDQRLAPPPPEALYGSASAGSPSRRRWGSAAASTGCPWRDSAAPRRHAAGGGRFHGDPLCGRQRGALRMLVGHEDEVIGL